MRLVTRYLLSCCFAVACPAAELYSFSYTAQSGPIHSFSFSFTSQGFLADGSVPAFAPFDVTDGTNTLTMTNGLAQVKDTFSCFLFGTPDAWLGVPFVPPFGGPCSLVIGGPGYQGGFAFDLIGPLPTAPGTYQPSAVVGIFGTLSGDKFIYVNTFTPTGTMTLDISEVSTPEPASFALIGCGLALVGALRLKRRRKIA